MRAAHGSLKVTSLNSESYRRWTHKLSRNFDERWFKSWCGGWKRRLKDERIYRAERRMWLYRTVAKEKKLTFNSTCIAAHTRIFSATRRTKMLRERIRFPPSCSSHQEVTQHNSNPITRQGQRDWMNLRICQICGGSGCTAPGIRFQGFYVLFMHAYRRMPFIVPSLHNSQEKLSCKLTSDLAIKKKVLRNKSRAVKMQPAGYADPAK